jgi:hypothetical protein
MMRRLRDQIDSSDPSVVRAARLLASAPPLDGDRFWNLQLPAGGARRPSALPLRMAAVLAMSLGTFAASAAVVPHLHGWNVPWATARGIAGPPPVAPPVTPPVAARPAGVARVTAPEVGAPRSAAAGEAWSPSPVLPSAAKAPSRPSGPAQRVASVAVANGAKAAPSDEAESGSESSLMVDAVRALRHDRDPARALSLAEVAMDRYPQGAQVEEAIALGMEAATAAGDPLTARKLAERYLAGFRTGQFADRAQQIVSAALR